jgi:hypothetical protein
MGIIRLSSKYRRWMGDTSFLNPDLYTLDTPEKMIEYYEDFYKRRRIRIVIKDDNGTKQSRMTTSRGKELQLDCEWNRFTPRKKAAVYAHEAVHYRQRGRFGNAAFEAQYVVDARFRVAMETPAYRESMSAYRAMGSSENWCRSYAEKIPGLLKRSYFIPTLNYENVKTHVVSSMLDEFENPWREVRRPRRKLSDFLK